MKGVERVPPGEMRFEDALSELEAIVRTLEAGEQDLEQSIALYERGVSLRKACQAKLDEAQQKITVLMGELEAEETPEQGPEAEEAGA